MVKCCQTVQLASEKCIMGGFVIVQTHKVHSHQVVSQGEMFLKYLSCQGTPGTPTESLNLVASEDIQRWDVGEPAFPPEEPG